MPAAKRRTTPGASGPDPSVRLPWTRARCLASVKWTEERAREEAHRNRFADPDRCVIAFRCPHGDHSHVALPPLACRACHGSGRNSRNGACSPCGETGVQQ